MYFLVALGNEQPFLVSEAQVTTTEEGRMNLHVLLQYVAEQGQVNDRLAAADEGRDSLCTAVELLSYCRASAAADSWSLDRARRYVFKGSLDFLSLSQDSSRLFASTDQDFSLVYDSQGDPVAPETEAEASASKPSEMIRPKFYYLQDVEELVVWVPIAADTTKRDIKVSVKPRELSVALKGEPVVAGELHHVVDTDSMTWTLQTRTAGGQRWLEVNVSKAATGRVWTSFYASQEKERDSGAAQVGGLAQAEEMETEFAASGDDKRVGGAPADGVFNSEELEECDAMPDKEFRLFGVDLRDSSAKRTTTNQQGNQWLFNTVNEDGQKLFCLRHDVDGLTW